MAKLELKRKYNLDSGHYIPQPYPSFDYLTTLIDPDLIDDREICIVWGNKYNYLPDQDKEEEYAIAVPLALGCGTLDEYADLLWGNPSADPYPEELYFGESFHPWLERIAAIHNWDASNLQAAPDDWEHEDLEDEDDLDYQIWKEERNPELCAEHWLGPDWYLYDSFAREELLEKKMKEADL